MSRRNLILVLIVLGFAFLIVVRPQSPKNGVINPADSPTPFPTPTATKRETPSPTGSAIAAATPAPRSSESLTVTPEVAAQFDRARSQALNSIPTRSDLQKLSAEQVHFTPPAVINAAVEIAKVSDLIDKNPGLSEKGLAFYKECAENENSSTTARASCLIESDELKTKSGSKIAQPAVGAHVKALADKAKR